MTRHTRIMTAIWVALALSACAAPRVEQPLTHMLGSGDEESAMAFWHALHERPLVCHDEAFHALLLFLDGKDESVDYAQRVAALQARKLLPAKWDRPAEEAVDRGTLAVALVQALNVRKGVLLTVMGPIGFNSGVISGGRRYATRELEDVGIFGPSSPWQTITGWEFVAVIGRAEDYLRGDMAQAPAELLPFEYERLQREKRARRPAPEPEP